MKGDIIEIGSYHGRSTCLLAYCLKEGERLTVCDAFDMDTKDRYRDRPTPDVLWSNLLMVNPGLKEERVVIKRCLSSELRPDEDARFRFAHIDGGHSYGVVTGDLALCAGSMAGGGVIAVDDYCHRDWPEVTKAVDDFLKARPDFFVLADLNRRGAIGRKIYLYRKDGP